MEHWERIRKLIDHFGMNVNNFSDEIGISNNVTIGTIINQHRKPTKKTLEKIIKRFPIINYDWLLTGQGKMLKEPKISDEDLPDLANVSERNEIYGNNYGIIINNYKQRISDLEKLLESRKHEIEYLNKIINMLEQN